MLQLITLLVVFKERIDEDAVPEAQGVHDRYVILGPDKYAGQILTLSWRPSAPLPLCEIDGRKVRLQAYMVAEPGAYRSPVYVNILEDLPHA